MKRDPAASSVHGVISMVAVVVILAAMVFLLIMGMLSFLDSSDSLAPPLIQITLVDHTKQGKMNLASRVTIQNMDSIEYPNKDLQAEFRCNGKELLADIFTLHGTDFIPTHHFGVSTMGGAGCSGDYFSPGEKILIDLTNGYYHPGDTVELRIYQRSSDSRPSPILGQVSDRDYMDDWFAENYYSPRDGYRLISQHRYKA